MSENITKMFYDDVKEKKRTGYGIYKRASRRGYVGTVRTDVDYLKGKEKKDYMQGSEVKVSNLYENIENVPSPDQLKLMDYEQAKSILEQAKKHHKAGELEKHWGKSQGYWAYMRKKYDITTTRSRTYNTKKKKKQEVPKQEVATVPAKSNEQTIKDIVREVVREEVERIQEQKDPRQSIDKNKSILNLNGTGKTLENKFLAISSLLTDDYVYEVEVTIKETSIIVSEGEVQE